jgi:CRP-like cAMP-binding protein
LQPLARLQESKNMLEEIAFKSIPARFSEQLLKLSAKSHSGASLVDNSRQDFAEMPGAYRKTTTHTRHKFNHDGWIEILQPEALQKVARTRMGPHLKS